MDHKYHSTAVENLVESLSFEVEAVTQDNVVQHKSASHLSPVNVKVRVRKKDKSSMQKGTICIPKARTDNHPERIRLASSDQTIMSFNVLMEDADYRKSKKKNIFGGCLHGTTDDDDGPYLPKEEASGSKSGYKQKLALSKTAGNQLAPGDVRRKPKNFFGPCKPGGCLDPPFGEDKYPYLPPDTKTPSTDFDIESKIPERPPVDDKIFEETPKPAFTDESDTKTPKPPTFDDKVDGKNPRPPSFDHTTDKKPSPCPKKENTCPAFNYKVDPATVPFPVNGFGSAALSSKEGTDIFDENESSTKHRKRKGSSDSASTVKISKRNSGISSSMQNVPKGRPKPPLEDKESNSIITYAGDEDDVDDEIINKNRKSSVNSNRKSFDLNAPYYLPPKRDSKDKDANEKTEKIRRSLEPLGKSQDEDFPGERDGKQKRMLRTGIELHDDDAVPIGENGQLNRKMDDNVTNTKYVKRPSLQQSQDKGIDKLNTSVRFPTNNTENELNEGSVVFLDSPDHYDKTEVKTYEKDQVSTRGSVSKNVDKTVEKYKINDITINNDNLKDSDTKTKKYSYSNQSNPNFSGIEIGKNNSLDKHSEKDTADTWYKDNMNLHNDIDIKQTESFVKRGLQSEKYNDYFGLDTTDRNNINKLQISPKDNQMSEYADCTVDSKSLHLDKEPPRYSYEKLDSKDIVTLKSGSFYKEMSDAESDYKVTDSRSSLTNKKKDGNDNTEVYTATDKGFSFMTKTQKVDINSKEKLYERDNVPPSTDGEGFELNRVESRRDTGTRKYEEVLRKTGKGSDINIGNDSNVNIKTRKYEEVLTKTGKGSDINIGNDSNVNIKTREMQAQRGSSSNVDIKNRKHDEILAKRGSGSNIDIRTREYDEMRTKTGSGSNVDIGLRKYDKMSTMNQKYDEISANRGIGLNIDIRTPEYDEMRTKTGSGSNVDIGLRKYDTMSTMNQKCDEISAKRGIGSNIDIRSREYDEMRTTTGSGSNIDIGLRKYDKMSTMNQKYDEISTKRGSGSNIDIRTREYNDMRTKTSSGSNIDIGLRKYDKMTVKRGSGAHIDTRIYDGMSAKTGIGSNIGTEPRSYNEMLMKPEANKLTRDISLDLAFQNYHDGSVRVLKTLETPLDSKLQANPDIFVVQKRISFDGERTQILIDPDTNMTIELNRHSVDPEQEKDHNFRRGILISDEHATTSHHQQTHPHVTFSSGHLHENLSYLYEKELVPLQNMIKNLKAEIDALAGQHKRREKPTQQRLRPVAHCNGIVIKK